VHVEFHVHRVILRVKTRRILRAPPVLFSVLKNVNRRMYEAHVEFHVHRVILRVKNVNRRMYEAHVEFYVHRVILRVKKMSIVGCTKRT